MVALRERTYNITVSVVPYIFLTPPPKTAQRDAPKKTQQDRRQARIQRRNRRSTQTLRLLLFLHHHHIFHRRSHPPPKPKPHHQIPTHRPYLVLLNLKMEIEVKLRLPNSAAHQLLSNALSPFHIKTHLQQNIFFDGSASELSSKLAVLRLRFYNNDSRCVVSLKAKAVLSNGVSRVEEDEEDIDPAIGRACVAEPWRLLEIGNSRILKRVKDEFGVSGFVCLGGFRNVRAVYDWKGLKLELDETQYDFGTSYEIECESTDPEGVKKVLEEFLKEKGIEYSYSEVSKFAAFRSGKLP